jgi:hypothetical protein
MKILILQLNALARHNKAMLRRAIIERPRLSWDVALRPELAILLAQPRELLTLGRRQPDPTTGRIGSCALDPSDAARTPSRPDRGRRFPLSAVIKH